MTTGDRLVFIDTGAWYALGDDSEQDHAAALRVWRQLTVQRVTLVTSNFVMAETHGLAVRRRGRDRALVVLRGILDGHLRLERVTEADEERAMAIIEQFADKAFSYTDATSFAIIERLGIQTAFSFDRHFAQFRLTTLGLDG